MRYSTKDYDTTGESTERPEDDIHELSDVGEPTPDVDPRLAGEESKQSDDQ